MAQNDDNLEIYTDENGQMSFKNEDDNYFPVASDYSKVPNRLIERYGNISYLANLGMMLAIQNITKRSKEAYRGTEEGKFYEHIYKESGTDFSDGLVACIPVQQFIKIYGLSSGGRTYQSIDMLYNGTILKNQWQIMYEDENCIATTSVLTGTMYNKKNKRLYMKFNPDLESVLLNMRENYARISLPVLGKLRVDYITNIYEIFKKRMDAEMGKNKKYGYKVDTEIKTRFDLDHLYFRIGIYPVDLTANDINMRTVVELLRAQDYSAAASIMKEKGLVEKYADDTSRVLAINDFAYFKRHFLDRAFKSINGFPMIKKLDKVSADTFDETYAEYQKKCRANHPTDIHFRYELVRSGKGGKVSGLIFYISKAEWTEEEEMNNVTDNILEQEVDTKNLTLDQMRVVLQVSDILKDQDLKEKDIITLARTAEWHVEKVEQAYEAAKQQNPNSFMGYMVDAIRYGWTPNERMKGFEEKNAKDEEYSLDSIKENIGYGEVLLMKPTYKDILDDFCDIIYRTLNTETTKIKFNSYTEVPAQLVKDNLLQLNSIDMREAIEEFLNSSGSTEHVSSTYILKILFEIKTQTSLKAARQVQRNEGLYS